MKSTFFTAAILHTFLIIGLFGCSSKSTEKTPAQNKAEIFYSAGTQSLINQDYTQALDNLIKAYELNPEDSKILNNLGMAYFFKGRNNEAIEYISKALKQNPKNSDARNNLASVYYTQGKYAEAKEQWHQVKEDLVYDHQYRTYYNLALIALKEGNQGQATEYLRLSLKENSEYCSAYFKLGEIDMGKNSFGSALKHFQEASKGGCSSLPAPVYHQGLALLKMRKYQDAMIKFDEVRNRFSKSPEAASAIVQLQQIKNEGSQQTSKISLKSSAPKRKESFTDKELEKDLNEYESPEF